MTALRITDRFEIKDDYHSRHLPGLVVVVEADKPLVAGELIGCALTIQTLSRVRRVNVTEAKQHGNRVGVFLPGYTLNDVAVGADARIEVPK